MIDRRRWLLAVAASTLAAGRVIGQDDPATADGPLPGAVRDRAKAAGLPELSRKENGWYVGLGTAPADYFEGAMTLCDGLADDYLKHFADRGFAVSRPAERLVLVVLDDGDQFARFLGVDEAPAYGGVYDLDWNVLVAFDHREAGRAPAGTERANTIALLHEATHQLTFNTGLLDRQADVPLVISEGLATYGEVRQPWQDREIGAVNRERLALTELPDRLRSGRALLPLGDLFADDELFRKAETEQLAYAECWLLIHGLMRSDAGRERFRSYLGALKAPADPPAGRVELAREHIGDLEKMDEGLRSYAARLLNRR